MMKIPYQCPRKQESCIALANIVSDGKESFFCCGENNGKLAPVAQDRYTVCFKGDHRDDMTFHDKRDLMHNSTIMMQALSVIQKSEEEDRDWSPWKDL